MIYGYNIMHSNHNEELIRYHVGAMPLLFKISQRLRLRDILLEYIPAHANEIVPAVDSLLLLIYNIALGKSPLYKFSGWVDRLDLRAIGFQSPNDFTCNDDRIGRAIDKIFHADRASLLTQLILSAINSFNVDISQIHNDSTSIKYYGKSKGKTKTGVEFKKGHSKDHRPDLNQIIFNLSISADGGIPIHHKTFSGNRTDDTVHIEIWNTLCKIKGSPDFTYVADSKLCTDKQLYHISHNKGQAITIIPNSWNEVAAFKDKLRKSSISKTEIWRRIKPGSLEELEYFSVFKGEYFTDKRKYKIHWIYSSEKKKRDRELRNNQLKQAEKDLAILVGNLNVRQYKIKDKISTKAKEIMDRNKVNGLINIKLGTAKAQEIKQLGKGRPGKKTQYEKINSEEFTLSWRRNLVRIKSDMKIDGVFPLLSTNIHQTSKKVLKVYKYQPNIEKRFSKFKSVNNAAPLLFKNIERVEGSMFAFFIAMLLQALLEREIHLAMKVKKIKELEVYPEHRCSEKPTANAIAEVFEHISTYQIIKSSKIVKSYKDKLNDIHATIINMLDITEKEYWAKAYA